MTIQRRIIVVTLGLMLAGAFAGAVSGVVAIEAAFLVYLRTLATAELLAASASIGVVFGAIAAPAIAWSLLRSVPIGRAVTGIAAGAGLGGAIGVLLGAALVNPYESLTLTRPPAPQGMVGALVGALLVAVFLRIRSRRATIVERPG